MSTSNGDPAQVPGWLTAAVERMARGTADNLDGLLVSVGEAVTLGGTRATCRCHFVERDGNGRPRLHALAQRLAAGVLDYCIPRSRIAEAAAYLAATGSSHKLVRLAEEARELFTTQQKSGEGGELLLYTLLESVLRIPQILCKMPLKTNTNMHIHGTDGIHAKVLSSGCLALYWGESKLHADVHSAIDDCFDSVAPFLLDSGGGVAERDLLLVRDNLDAGAAEVTEALIRYFSEDTPDAARLEVRAACLVGFSLDGYPDPFDASGQHVRDQVRDAISRWHDRIGNRIDRHLLHDFELEVFCVPMPSVDEFRAAIRTELGLAS